MQVTETKKKSFLSGLTGQIIIAMVLGATLGIIIAQFDFAGSCTVF